MKFFYSINNNGAFVMVPQMCSCPNINVTLKTSAAISYELVDSLMQKVASGTMSSNGGTFNAKLLNNGYYGIVYLVVNGSGNLDITWKKAAKTSVFPASDSGGLSNTSLYIFGIIVAALITSYAVFRSKKPNSKGKGKNHKGGDRKNGYKKNRRT